MLLPLNQAWLKGVPTKAQFTFHDIHTELFSQILYVFN